MATARRIRIRPVKGFKALYQAYATQTPAVKKAMQTFNVIKRRIPPEPLPRK